MTIDMLLAALAARGLRLSEREGRLQVLGKIDQIEPELREALLEHKQQLLAMIASYDAEPQLQAGNHDRAPLTTNQAGILRHQLAAPTSNAYHMPIVLRLRGVLRIAVLREAFADIVRRHPTLVSRYVAEGERMWQQLIPGKSVPVDLVDTTQPDLDISSFIDRPFDLAAGEAFRARLLRIEPDVHVLVCVVHHLAADGWSTEILKRDLADTYHRRLHGLDPAPMPDLDFFDIAQWHATKRQHARNSDAAFWGDYFKDVAAVAEIAYAPKPDTRPSRIFDHLIPPGLQASIGVTAGVLRATPYQLIVAALGACLWRMTRSGDIVICRPQANRTRREMEAVVGLFLDALPLRVCCDATQRFIDVCAQVAADIERTSKHAGLAMGEILSLSGMDPGRDVHPLQQVAVNLLDYAQDGFALEDVAIEELPVDRLDAKYALTLYLSAGPDGLRAQYHVRTDRFSGESVALLHSHLLRMLEQCSVDPELCIGAVELDTVPHAVEPVPSVGMEPCPPVPALFRRAALAHPQSPALLTETGTVSYSILLDRVDHLASRVAIATAASRGVVVIVANRNEWLPAAMLACLQAGRIYTVIDAGAAIERQSRMLSQVDIACWIFTDEEEHSIVSRFDSNAPCLIAADIAGEAQPRRDWPVPKHDQPACLTFTSGSAGQPRGVIGRQGALTSHLAHLCSRFGIGATDRFAMVGGLMSDPLQRDVFTPLCLGGSVAVPGAGDLAPGHFGPWLRAAAVSVVNLTPGLACFLTADNPIGLMLPELRWVMACGDMLRWAEVATLREFAPHAGVVNLYGMTESQRALAEHVCVEPGAPTPRCRDGVVPIGRFGAGTRIDIRNESGGPVAWGEPGELFIDSDGLALGYLDASAETAERFVPGADGRRLLRTGDRGRYLPDGSIRYLGRIDQQVNVLGFRFVPSEVDICVCAWPEVARCRTVAERGAGDETELTLYWVAADADLSSTEIRRRLRRSLPAAMVPAHIERVVDLPLNLAGKVDIARLTRIDRPASGHVAMDAFAAAVARLWSDVLGRPVTALDDDFFLIGGSSLSALRLCDRLSKVFGVRYPVARLFEYPSLRSCVDYLRIGTGEATAAEDSASVMASPSSSPFESFEPFALTEVQEAYWVGRASSLAGGGFATGSYLEFDLRQIEPKRIAAAIDRLVERHSMLRAIVTPDGRQQVLEQVPSYVMPVRDLAAVTATELEQALAQWRRQMCDLTFDAGRWPLFDIRLSVLPQGMSVLHVAIDMLMVDFLSSMLLAEEFDILLSDAGSLPPPSTYQFADHVRLIQTHRESATFRTARDYWMERLDSLPLAPALPVAANPSATTNVIRRSFALTSGQWTLLEARARAIGVTRAVILLTAYASTLARWSEQARFSIVVTLYDRFDLTPEAARTVGDFTSLLLLELDLPTGSFADRARHVQQRLLLGLQHRSFGAISVLRELSRRHGGGAPLFVPFVFTDTLDHDRIAQASSPGVAPILRERYRYSRTSQVWIDHTTTRTGDGIALHWTSIDQIFAEGLVDSMFAAYSNLLGELAASESHWNSPRIDTLPDKVRARREEYNHTAHPLPSGRLETFFLQRVREQPDHPALISDEVTLSYAQLLARAQAMAQRLHAMGIARGEPVVVFLPKSVNQIVAVLAVLLAGAAYLPIDPAQPTARIDSMLAQAQTDIAIGDVDAVMPAAIKRRLAVEDALNTISHDIPGQGIAVADDPAYIIFTSGSTGVPKGVVITHAAAVNTVLAINELFSVGPADRVFAISSLSFDLSVYDIFGTLAAGAAIVLPTTEQLDRPASWMNLVKDHEVTIWNSVPALQQVFCDGYSEDAVGWPESLRLVMLSGDWIPLALAKRLLRRPRLTLVSLGGATEAAIWSIYHIVGAIDPVWRSIPYGQPLPNQTIHVLRDDGSACPDQVIGEIHIGGIGLAREYCGDPERTGCAFRTDAATGNRLYRTGDLGRFGKDGRLELLGRRDHQVKLSGHRIELGEIEVALRELPGIDEAVVVVRRDAGEPQLVAFLIDRSLATDQTDVDGYCSVDATSAQAFRDQLAGHLPASMLPREFVRLSELPLGANGKIDRMRLSSAPLQTDGSVAASNTALSLSALEMEIAQLWAEYLPGHAEFGGKQGFFAMGGNSLSAMRLLNRLRQKYGISMSIGEFYRHERLAELAAMVERKTLLDSIRMTSEPRSESDRVIALEGEL